jgi:hypothetical protein
MRAGIVFQGSCFLIPRVRVHRFAARCGRRGCDVSANARSPIRRGGVHRLRAAVATTGSCPVRECLRAVPCADRRRARVRPERDGDLAGPGRRSRLCRPLRQCPALRAAAARPHARRCARGDHDGAGRGRASRLRRRADGAAPGDRGVSAHAALPADAGLLAEGRAPPRLAVQCARVGRAEPSGHSGRPRTPTRATRRRRRHRSGTYSRSSRK